MQPAPCPTAKALEDLYYPDVHDIVIELISMVDKSPMNYTDVPRKESMTDFYKHFKGPF
jgi:pyruvate dehydrogenase E1 component beta subunit